MSTIQDEDQLKTHKCESLVRWLQRELSKAPGLSFFFYIPIGSAVCRGEFSISRGEYSLIAGDIFASSGAFSIFCGEFSIFDGAYSFALDGLSTPPNDFLTFVNDSPIVLGSFFTFLNEFPVVICAHPFVLGEFSIVSGGFFYILK